MAEETVKIKLQVDSSDGKQEIKEFEYSLDSLEAAYRDIQRSAKGAADAMEREIEVMQRLDGQLVKTTIKAKDVVKAFEQIRADKFKGIKEAAGRFEELGGKISDIGGRITAAFTLPIVGAFAAAISQSEQLQAALQPIQNAFTNIAAELGNALVPLVQELTPLFIDLANSILGVVKWFADLPTWAQGAIVAFLGFVAAVGPIVMMIGQMVMTFGVMQSIIAGVGTALPGLATAFTTFGATAMAALWPIALILGSIIAIIAALNSETGRQGLAIIAAMGGAVTGGREGALNAFMKAKEDLGLNQPAPTQGGFGGQTIIYNNNGIDMNNPIIQQALSQYTNQTLRTNGMR